MTVPRTGLVPLFGSAATACVVAAGLAWAGLASTAEPIARERPQESPQGPPQERPQEPPQGIRVEPPDLEVEESGPRGQGPSWEDGPRPGHSFYFTRAVYSGGRGFRRPSWATDFPKADRQFLFIMDRLLKHLDAYEWENPVRLDDPELHRYPFLYALEVGYMSLTESEVQGLRRYLEAGGFLIIDDFWGSWQWQNFEYEISRVLPGRPIVQIPLDHPIFHQFYDIDEILQVPSINNARWGQTWEQDGYQPFVLGIFDDNEELMVVINWNTDLGDAWEWSEQPEYPFERSSFAYELAVNYIIYAMTH